MFSLERATKAWRSLLLLMLQPFDPVSIACWAKYIDRSEPKDLFRILIFPLELDRGIREDWPRSTKIDFEVRRRDQFEERFEEFREFLRKTSRSTFLKENVRFNLFSFVIDRGKTKLKKFEPDCKIKVSKRKRSRLDRSQSFDVSFSSFSKIGAKFS